MLDVIRDEKVFESPSLSCAVSLYLCMRKLCKHYRVTVSEVVRCTTAAVNTRCPVNYPVCSDFVYWYVII